MRLIATSIALAALVLATSSVQAQDATAASEPVSISLGVDGGNVLVSTGGEFAQVASGHALNPGDRVLVSEGGSATLTYGNGCQKHLGSAGVYTISVDCMAPGSRSPGSGPSAGVIAGVVGGVAVIAAAAGGGGSDNDRPVSR